MDKKKVKDSKAVAKKSGGKEKGKEKEVEQTPEEVRKELVKLVKAHARKMASAVIEQGETGQVAPMKYLLEMAHVFPEVNDGSEATKDEDCLAKTLLDRLNIPDKPVVADEEDEFVTIPPRKAEVETESEAEKSGKERVEEKEEEVTVVG